MQRIMVATDGSDGANRAIGIAAEIAKALHGTLFIVSVVEQTLSEEEKAQFGRVEGELANATELVAQRALDAGEQRALRAGIASPNTSLLLGDVAQSIIDAIRSEKADAVVVGRRGRGRVASLLLGSVSQELTRAAPCVVVVVP